MQRNTTRCNPLRKWHDVTIVCRIFHDLLMSVREKTTPLKNDQKNARRWEPLGWRKRGSYWRRHHAPRMTMRYIRVFTWARTSFPRGSIGTLEPVTQEDK